ncbi:hypothetical protein C4566_01690 [Candidatus Parcubacteria bacterium]|nr:MAG: hypothetical protein C4566_01690 [Candidatus Parcubacteria bacterium]
MRFLVRIKLFFKDKLVLALSIFSLGFILATWVQFLGNKVEHSPITVLHYNIYSGFDMVGEWRWLYLIPLIVLVASLINFLLASWLWQRQPIWSYLLLTDNLLINFASFIYILNILNYSL